MPLDLPPNGRLQVGLRPSTPGAPGIPAKRSPLINRGSKVKPLSAIKRGAALCQNSPIDQIFAKAPTHTSF